jgi:uncharacterized protein YjbI with pentapeptide repeats
LPLISWTIISKIHFNGINPGSEPIFARYLLLADLAGGLSMANQEQLQILMQGAEQWNRWRIDHSPLLLDLTGEDFAGKDFTGFNLAKADLRKTNLRDALLIRADLSYSDLRAGILDGADLTESKLLGSYVIGTSLVGASLVRADLTSADFSKADLRSVALNKADLLGTYLIEANIEQANLNDSNMWLTVISGMDLSQAIGLDSVNHHGPSFVDIHTIFRSGGKIPEVFLRGVGIPDNFIEYMPSLIGEAVQFYSCFISYSTKDQEFAERLHSDLQSKGVRCWFAPEDIKGGRKLHEQIPEAIRLYDKLLLVLSENSMNSEWVKTEIYHARQDEIRTGKRKLFPIGLIDFEEILKWQAFDADVGKDMAREVREYYIPDFSDWKNHDSYKKAFDRLLRDLQAEEDL